MISRLAFVLVGAALVCQSAEAPAVQYTADHKLVFPASYREWIYLSSGLGMEYGPAASAQASDHPAFDNVFVNRDAYHSFVNTGSWPDHTVFILENRGSESKGSINQGGHFQGGINGIAAEVKDSSQPEKWRFYSFDRGAKAGALIPATASCYGCHAKNGAVDNTFVQFYPTLRPIAERYGTFRTQAEH